MHHTLFIKPFNSCLVSYIRLMREHWLEALRHKWTFEKSFTSEFSSLILALPSRHMAWITFYFATCWQRQFMIVMVIALTALFHYCFFLPNDFERLLFFKLKILSLIYKWTSPWLILNGFRLKEHTVHSWCLMDPEVFNLINP